MAEELASAPIFWQGVRVGVALELSADMYWWHARWRPDDAPETAAFLAQVEAGEDPEVVIAGPAPLRLQVTAATREELELKSLA